MEAGEQALASTHAATARAPFEAKWIVIGIAVAMPMIAMLAVALVVVVLNLLAGE